MVMKYQVMGLKALLWFQSWCEDDGMPYQQFAMEMFNLIENTIVNSQLPSSHEPKLIKKKDFEKLVQDEKYQAYDGIIKSKKQEKANSGRGDTSLSD